MSNTKLAAVIAAAAISAFTAVNAYAAGELAQSWRTDHGWLTELRLHPDGAKVCSTAKASNIPHAFGITFVRSGAENIVLLADQQQPPAMPGIADMSFVQDGKARGKVKVEVAGPAWVSVNPSGPQATTLMSELSEGPLTIDVAGRQYEADLTGLPDALRQLGRCAEQASAS
jgi:hypothetical protein